ncbi:MAG: hypothetical protein ABSA46_02260 [Thermodesulfovibrionales bacterium]|jgi:SAM-dependent methyltransferase
MGIDINGAKFLIGVARSGVKFDTCATLGRQEMHVTSLQLVKVFQQFSVPVSIVEAKAILENHGAQGYSEAFLERCGAEEIVSFDNSDYEGASVVHDMNLPLPGEYEQAFDCVIDSGSLEHIFNFPVAIHNCMKMVRVGGHFLSMAPCNNFMGHGFYQFSPELFFGVLSEENGFVIERMLIFECRLDSQWYTVAKPARLGGRVELLNSRRTYLLVQARRKKITLLNTIAPQQSDYVTTWSMGHLPPKMARAGSANAIVRWQRLLRGKIQEAIRLLPIETVRTPFRRPWYEPFHWAKAKTLR